MNQTLDPLQPHFEDDAIHDARQRLAQTRFPEAETVEDWQQGVPLSYCQELVRYWRDDYDWQRVPNQLAQYENWMTELEGVRIHVVHVRPLQRGIVFVGEFRLCAGSAPGTGDQ